MKNSTRTKRRQQRLLWAGATGLSGLLTGIGAGSLAEKVWQVVRGHRAPRNPASPQTTWSDAILWSGMTGMLTAVATVSAERALVSLWTRLTGRLPDL